MVVTDLHGDRAAFDRVLQHFTARRERSEVQRLIFLGDLIHHYGPAQADASLSMVLDVMRLQAELGSDTVIMLLGNHELPHIYGLTLAKGEREFTPRFEHELNDHREAVLSFFRGLPFYVRTSAGVTLGHAGPRRKPRCRPPLCAISTTMLYSPKPTPCWRTWTTSTASTGNITSCTASPTASWRSVIWPCATSATRAIHTCCAAF